MPRLKIRTPMWNKNNEQDTYVPADELSVEETDLSLEEEKTMERVQPNGTVHKRKRKKKNGKDVDKTKRKASATAAWIKALRDTNATLDTSDEGTVELGKRVNDLARAGKRCIGQRALAAAKEVPLLGEAMAVNETTMQVRETVANGRDVLAGAKFVGSQVARLFSGA